MKLITHRFAVDNDDISAGLDVHSWIRKEVEAKYGSLAMVDKLTITSDPNFLEDTTVIAVDIILTEE